MNKYVHRMLFFHGKERISPLYYIFMFTTIVWVVIIAFFPDNPSVQYTGLYIALNELSPMIRELWGWAGMGVLAGNAFVLFARIPVVAKAIAFIGFLLWAYALTAQVVAGMPVLAMVVGLPHVLFWVWYYFETLRYERVSKGLEKERPHSSEEE